MKTTLKYTVVVKVLTSDDGEKRKFSKWCLLTSYGDTTRTLCTGEALDGSSAATYKSKKGKITCDQCRKILKEFKSIKL